MSAVSHRAAASDVAINLDQPATLKPVWEFALFAGAAALIWLREPLVFLTPNLYAEEGAIYFAYAFSHGPLEVLATPHLGYYSLYNNLVMLIATSWFPLEVTPVLTTWSAFAVQLAPVAIVIWGRSVFWRSAWMRVLAVAIILFSHHSCGVWVSTIHAQFWLALAAFLILLEDLEAARPLRRWFFRALLTLGGLTGVLTCFLAPFFLHRAWTERRREPLIHAAILCLCALLHVLIMAFVPPVPAEALSSRAWTSDPRTIVAVIWIKNILLPLFDRDATQPIVDAVLAERAAGPWAFTALGVILLAGLLSGLWALTAGMGRRLRVLFAAGFLLVSFSSVVSAIGRSEEMLDVQRGGHRYFFITNVILLLMLAWNAPWNRAMWRSARAVICASLLFISLGLGVLYYRSRIEPFYDPAWPVWRNEIRQWKSNPDRRINIWPEGWFMILDARKDDVAE